MSLPINIKELITGNVIESERIEFKKGWNPQSILHTICAFANDSSNIGGGYIIVGVAEDHGQAVMPPAGIDSRQMDSIQKELLHICHYISPNYFPVIEPTVIDGKQLLAIWVPPGDVRPYKAPKSLADKSNKPYYIRRYSSTIQASDDDLQRLMSLAAKITFDNRINHHATLEDLNLVHIATFLKEVKSSLYPELPKIPLDDLCRQMGIARGSDEDLRPLNVALLLFNDEPREFFRGAQVDLVEYSDDIGDNFSENIFTGPIQFQLRDVLRYLKNNLIKEYVQKVEGQAEANRFYNYPYEVLEEALANAIYHKSYDRQNPIEINIRLDRVEIISYAGPMPPVNQKMLNSERVITRDYRNSRIGDFLKEMDLTEGRSTGIPKMRFFMKRNGSPEPVFKTDDDLNFFLVTLFPHPLAVAEEPAEHVTQQVIQQVTQQVIELLKQVNGELSRSQLMEAVGLRDRVSFSKSYLEPALFHELIERTQPNSPTSPTQKYRLTARGIAILEKQL